MTHSSRGFVILYLIFGVLAAAACFKIGHDTGLWLIFYPAGAAVCFLLAGLIYALLPHRPSLRELEKAQLEQEKYELHGEAISVADRTVDGRMRASMLDAIHKRIDQINEELKKYDD
jgi:membrane protein implicated in regulation of membrane protease activity